MINFTCPTCEGLYAIDDDMLGRKVSCGDCEARFFIPADGEDAILAPPKFKMDIVDEPQTEHKSPAAPPNNDKIVVSFDIPQQRTLSPRQRRLIADENLMRDKYTSFQYIRLQEAHGKPPERYVVEYNVKGIDAVENGKVIYRNQHQVEITLPSTYPRTPPHCRMLTKIFHPNIEPAVICIGDHWTAGERLCDLVVRIGEMITYQSHNIRSPLDGEAAMWTDLNQDLLPIDNCDLMPSEQNN